MQEETPTRPSLPAPEPATPRPDAARCRHRFWVLTCLVIAALLLRLPLLDRPVWFDEACMSSQRIGTWAQLLATLYVDIHPPLFVTLMHVWNGWFGDGEVVMRLPALLCGLAAIPLVWWTGSRLVSHHAAMWAAILLALSPAHVWYSTEARLYTPMVCCTLLLFGTFDRLMAPGGARRRGLFLLHVLNVAVMLALHYYLAVFVVALAALAPLYGGGFNRRTVRILLSHGLGVVLLAAFVFAKQSLGQFETSQDYLRALDAEGLSFFLFDWSWSGNTLPSSAAEPLRRLAAPMFWTCVLLLGLGVVHVVRNARSRPGGLLVPVGVLTLPAFLLVCVLFDYGRTYMERSLIPALPFVLLLAGAGLMELRRQARLVLGTLTAAMAAAALIALYEGFDDRWTVYKPHPDWRSAAAWLGGEIDRGGAGRPVFTSMPNPRSLSYYDPRIQDDKNLRAPVSPEELGAKVQRRLGAWFGRIARDTFAEFVAHNDELRRGSKLLIRRSQPTPALLELPPDRPDGLCYLIRNEWHPPRSIDDSIERLLAHPDVAVEHTVRFPGVTIYKVRIAP